MQTTLDITKEVGSMIWEHHTKQGYLVQSIVLFKDAFTTGSTMKPETRLSDICRRAVAKGRTYHSLSTCSRVLIFLCHITQETTSKLFDVKLAFEEDKLTVNDHDKGNVLQLTHIHTALSW